MEKEARTQREKDEERLAAERLEKGLKYAKKIFAWAEIFGASEKGIRFMEVSHVPTSSKCIFFFEDIKGRTYIRLGISRIWGLFWDHWTSRFPAFHQMASPKALASSVDTRILKSACEQIENGKVWRCIEKGFDYLKNKQKISA